MANHYKNGGCWGPTISPRRPQHRAFRSNSSPVASGFFGVLARLAPRCSASQPKTPKASRPKAFISTTIAAPCAGPQAVETQGRELAAIMKTLQTLTIMASIWTFFSCNSKGQVNSFKPNSIQDTKSKIVRQNIFGEETSFNYSDFNNLKNNKNYDRFLIGQLYLPTGQVVCTDPMYRELGLPQNWTVKKGDYPVYIYIGLSGDFEGRVAYAELVIKDEIPTYWELSLISENLLSDNFEKKINGMYPVEAGLSCFADFETYKIFDKDVSEYNKADTSNNYYNDKLEKLFKENKDIPKSSRGEDWINYQIGSRNVIMFGSGWGDGLYPKYVGYDKDGNVVKFITDFIQITDEKEK